MAHPTPPVPGRRSVFVTTKQLASELPPVPLAPPEAGLVARFHEVYGRHGVTFVGPPLPLVLAREERP